MKAILIILLLLGASMAAIVTPRYLGIKDTGDQNEPKMVVGIRIDCDTKDLLLDVSTNGTGTPVVGATEYLFYTDYGYQPLPNSVKTGANGTALMKVPGSIDFLTGLFILRTDHLDHQSREIEFSFEKCFQDPGVPIGEVYGEGGGDDEPPPELKKLEVDVEPVCSGTAVTGEKALVKSDGKPLPDAFVSVEDISPAKKIASGKTDAAGEFRFPGCGDDYSVRASMGGYESSEVNVTLTGCDECPLPPPPPVQPQVNGSQQPASSVPDGAQNGTPETGDGKPAPSACPLGLLALCALVIGARK